MFGVTAQWDQPNVHHKSMFLDVFEVSSSRGAHAGGSPGWFIEHVGRNKSSLQTVSVLTRLPIKCQPCKGYMY
eukprot:5201397-Prymnesium_polylepis.1